MKGNIFRPVFILESSNAEDGSLSAIALTRVDKAIALTLADANVLLYPTGGFSDHFNVTKYPHRDYVADEILRRGVRVGPTEHDELLSTNTVEDATQVVAFTQKYGLGQFEIITSAFHVARCNFIFKCVVHDFTVKIHAAVDPEDLTAEKIMHETAALDQLLTQGGVMVGSRLLRP